MKMSDLGAVRDAEQVEYDRYLNALQQYNTDRTFNYRQLLDQIGYESGLREEALKKAELGGQYGDYSLLQNLGITPDTYDRDFTRKYQEAILKAQYGDFSGLKALGINVDLETMPAMNGGTGTETNVGGDGGNYDPGMYQELLRVTGGKKVLTEDEWGQYARVYGEGVIRGYGFLKDDGSINSEIQKMVDNGATLHEVYSAIDNWAKDEEINWLAVEDLKAYVATLYGGNA